MKRPILLKLLVVLYLFSGLGILLIFASAYPEFPGLKEFGEQEKYLFFFSTLILASLYITSSIGILLHKRWGWYANIFLCIYNLVRYINVLIAIPKIFADYDGSGLGSGYYYQKSFVRIIFTLIILFYFYRPRVMTYFGLGNISFKGKTIIAFGFVVGILLFGFLMGQFFIVLFNIFL